jgi:DNA-binding transcriptional LysR family regulator
MNVNHPLANEKSLKLKDVKDEPFVMISRDESPKGFDGIISLCKKHGFRPNIVKQLPNVESLMLCVEMGLGITLLDSNIRLHDNDNFRVFKVEGDYIDVIMAWKKENMNPSIPLFTNNVLSEVKL